MKLKKLRKFKKKQPNKSLKKKKISDPPQQEIDSLINLYNSQNMSETENRCRELLNSYPNSLTVLNIYGASLMAQGNMKESLSIFTRALQLNPNFPDAYINRGNALQGLGKLEKALNDYNKAIQLNPRNAKAYSNRGNIFKGMGRQAEAVKNYSKAIKLNPDYAMAHSNLGITFQEMGQLDQALKSFENALKIEPNYAEVYRNLSNLKKYTHDDSLIQPMLRLYSNSRNSIEKMHICFALAKVYEDLEEFEQSFNYLDEGNNLRKRMYGYRIDKDRDKFQKIKHFFFKTNLSDRVVNGTEEKKLPIFIIGMPRSGTSLIEQILASHKDVYGAGELYTLNNLASPLLARYNFNDTNKSEQMHAPDVIAQLFSGYLSEIMKISGDKKHVTDKMPLNFQWVGFIILAFPQAKIINVNRYPVATCFSNYKHYFSGQGNGFAYDQEDVARFYLLYNDLMNFWREKFPGKIYDINYENLTENQNEETRKLLEYCELEWDENCLNFHKSTRAVKTVSAAQVRKKMYQGSSEAWKRYEPFLQPMIKILNGV